LSDRGRPWLERDFEEAKKGSIAAPPYKQIKAEADHVAWDMGQYEFLWYAHSYHGSNEHNSRAVISRYLSYWDSNPAQHDPSVFGPNPTRTLLANSYAANANAAKGAARRFCGRGSVNHATTRTRLIAGAIRMCWRYVFAKPM
jgi:alkyl sulfatase BDS1-like metallo-beta-lactamase superfamily hydrolase